jgi:hypothetical protein
LAHKKYEFEYFYVLEKQYIICLILIFGMKSVSSSIPFFEIFNLVLDPSEGELLLNLKAYVFSFIFIISIVNLIIINCFNPAQGLKLAATCIGCFGWVGVLVYWWVLSKLYKLCISSGNRGGVAG